MKYWKEIDVLERDVLEGESITDPSNPHPAYRGLKLLSDGSDRLFEIEIIPGTERVEPVVDPITFHVQPDTVVDMLYRSWDDDTNTWNEMTITIPLKIWGYSTTPHHHRTQLYANFDYAMKGMI